METIEEILTWIFLLLVGRVGRNPFITIISSILGFYVAIQLLETEFIIGLVICGVSIITMFEASKEL